LTVPEAAARFHKAAIGLQKIREKDAIAAKHEPALRHFFEVQYGKVMFRFQFMQEYFPVPETPRLMEAKKPISPAALKRWEDIWQDVETQTTQDLQRIITSIEAEGLLKGGEQMRNLINPGGKFWDIKNPRAVAWFRKNGGSVDYIKGIQQTTADSLKAVVINALETGQGYGKTAQEIRDLFDEPISRKRAQLIATNEAAQSYEAGNRGFADSLKDDGVVMEKSWQNSGDDRVSDGCLENTADGWIGIDEEHSSGDQNPPRFPGCRCWEIYREAKA